jgi:hypothetical protein
MNLEWQFLALKYSDLQLIEAATGESTDLYRQLSKENISPFHRDAFIAQELAQRLKRTNERIKEFEKEIAIQKERDVYPFNLPEYPTL